MHKQNPRRGAGVCLNRRQVGEPGATESWEISAFTGGAGEVGAIVPAQRASDDSANTSRSAKR